jgi:hypothetical protein
MTLTSEVPVFKYLWSRFIAILVITSTGLMAAAETPKLGFADSNSQCTDWSVSMTFEQASAEYLRLAATESPDFGCLSRSSWMAVEDLFRSTNSAIYIARLKLFDADFRKQNINNPRGEKAMEDLKVLLQLRWLSESYESLRLYNSSTVIQGAAGATVATLFVAGAAILLHSPNLVTIQTTARPALLRMVRYLGAMIFAKMTGEAVSAHNPNRSNVSLSLRPPPMDLIGSSNKIFWNYTDLHFMRDIATATADAVTFGAVQATVMMLALRYVGTAVTTGGFFSASSLIGLALAYPAGKVAGHYTEKWITDAYHKSYREETERLAAQLKQSSLTDWQRYSIGAELTKGAIAWVSTQDLFLQTHIEDSVSSFGYWQICTRLRQHSMKEVFDNHQALAAKREILMGRSTPVVDEESAQVKDRETQERFSGYFTDAEKRLRADVTSAVEDKRFRLVEVRQGLVDRMKVLEEAGQPYLRSFIVQHEALLGRLDRYLTRAPLVDVQVEHVREQVAALAIGSAKWQDAGYAIGLTAEYQCN